MEYLKKFSLLGVFLILLLSSSKIENSDLPFDSVYVCYDCIHSVYYNGEQLATEAELMCGEEAEVLERIHYISSEYERSNEYLAFKSYLECKKR